MHSMDWLIFPLMLATLGVLVLGVITMMRGKDSARSNRLMAWRVKLQAAVILLLGLMFMLSQSK